MKVRFSPFPQVHSEVPWRTGGEKILCDDNVLYPVRSALKEDVISLRTEIDEEGTSVMQMAVLVICLAFLFLIIWWVVSRILLLEVEAQVKAERDVGKMMSNLLADLPKYRHNKLF